MRIAARSGLIAGLFVLASATRVAHAEQRPVTLSDFSACTIEAPGGVRSFDADCARLDVPEDPQRADGRRLSLRLVRIAASDRPVRPDPVLLIAGGPGQSAVDAWSSAEPGLSEIARHRDILLLDQRGTGDSNPLPCAIEEDDIDEADRERWMRAAAEDARQCVAMLSEKADLRRYTTTDAVRDIESLRTALGVDALNLYAGSYGTRVALEYLRRYPSGVRTMILDGVVPPQRTLGQDHGRNLDQALASLFAACVASAPCAERFGNPAATLGNLLARVREHPQSVRVNDPYDASPSDQRLDALRIITVLRFMAYQPDLAILLPLLVDEAWEGRPQPLIAQSQMVMQRLGDQLMHGMELSVICSEDADLMQVDEAERDTLLGGLIQTLFAAQCAVWPNGGRPDDFHDPVRSDVPALLLSGSWDPVTPPAFAAEVAESLPNARTVVVKGRGHIVLDAGCLPRRAATFLDARDAKALDLECLDHLRPPAFFVGYQGPAP